MRKRNYSKKLPETSNKISSSSPVETVQRSTIKIDSKFLEAAFEWIGQTGVESEKTEEVEERELFTQIETVKKAPSSQVETVQSSMKIDSEFPQSALEWIGQTGVESEKTEEVEERELFTQIETVKKAPSSQVETVQSSMKIDSEFPQSAFEVDWTDRHGK